MPPTLTTSNKRNGRNRHAKLTSRNFLKFRRCSNLLYTHLSKFCPAVLLPVKMSRSFPLNLIGHIPLLRTLIEMKRIHTTRIVTRTMIYLKQRIN